MFIHNQTREESARPPGQHILSRDSFPSFRRHQSPFKNNCALSHRWTQKLPRANRDLYQRAQILTTQFSSSLKSINHDSTNELTLHASLAVPWRKGCVGPVINSLETLDILIYAFLKVFNGCCEF
jgi:hypothetical protein